jgi:hypothetical protein
MAWSETARRAFYVRKYGEEEGEERFQQWMDSRDGEAPRQDGSVAPGERAPGRAARAKPKPADVYAAMATAIYAIDTGATWFSPVWAQERLTQEEIGRLAQATGDEVLNSKQLTAWLMRASKSGVHVKLALVLASIAIPRMVNHGMLPAQVAADAADVAGGGAYGDHRPDGVWEVDPDVPMAGDTDPLRGAEEQGGFDEVPEEPTYTHGRRNGRSTAVEDNLAAAIREAGAGVF